MSSRELMTTLAQALLPCLSQYALSCLEGIFRELYKFAICTPRNRSYRKGETAQLSHIRWPAGLGQPIGALRANHGKAVAVAPDGSSASPGATYGWPVP